MLHPLTSPQPHAFMPVSLVCPFLEGRVLPQLIWKPTFHPSEEMGKRTHYVSGNPLCQVVYLCYFMWWVTDSQPLLHGWLNQSLQGLMVSPKPHSAFTTVYQSKLFLPHKAIPHSKYKSWVCLGVWRMNRVNEFQRSKKFLFGESA